MAAQEGNQEKEQLKISVVFLDNGRETFNNFSIFIKGRSEQMCCLKIAETFSLAS